MKEKKPPCGRKKPQIPYKTKLQSKAGRPKKRKNIPLTQSEKIRRTKRKSQKKSHRLQKSIESMLDDLRDSIKYLDLSDPHLPIKTKLKKIFWL